MRQIRRKGFGDNPLCLKKNQTPQTNQEPSGTHQEPSGRCQEPSGTHQEPSPISQLAKLADYLKVAPHGRTCAKFGAKDFFDSPWHNIFLPDTPFEK